MGTKKRRSARALTRIVLAPAGIAVFSGLEFSSHGTKVATLGAYGIFVLAQVFVRAWDDWQLQRACSRLAAVRARMDLLQRGGR